jgi:uncharacterized phage-associated protein
MRMDLAPDIRAPARYAVHTAKALEMILWLAKARPGIDIYHVVKAAYFADKAHLNAYGRPIAGDDYDADTYGPLGRTIYRLLRHDPMEMIALGGNGQLPFRVRDDQKWAVYADRDANLKLLSQSDVAALGEGLSHAADLSFDDLVEQTHADPAYVRAEGGRMRYEDMLDRSDPDYAEKAADLASVAASAML